MRAYGPLVVEMVQPGFAIGRAPTAPSGMVTRTEVVAESLQPCVIWITPR